MFVTHVKNYNFKGKLSEYCNNVKISDAEKLGNFLEKKNILNVFAITYKFRIEVKNIFLLCEDVTCFSMTFFSILVKKSMLSYLHYINEVIEEFRADQLSVGDRSKIRAEWQLISCVIDRCCFITFSLVSSVVTASMLLSSPK